MKMMPPDAISHENQLQHLSQPSIFILDVFRTADHAGQIFIPHRPSCERKFDFIDTINKLFRKSRLNLMLRIRLSVDENDTFLIEIESRITNVIITTYLLVIIIRVSNKLKQK